MRDRGRRDRAVRRRPVVETLEGRDLPSAAAAIGAAGRPGAAAIRDFRSRDQFSAAFSGSYATGPARFGFRGGGTSNAFLHGDVLMSVAFSGDPAGSLGGTASLFDKNYTSSSNVLILDLQGDPADVRGGRPVRLTWTVADGSSGTFTGAEGEGTVEVRYPPGGQGQRRASVIFRGRVQVDGTTNALQVR
jgi:hypothetical protein